MENITCVYISVRENYLQAGDPEGCCLVYKIELFIVNDKYDFIIYQCYVYRTNIRHIPPEVAWECDTTSVIRRM